jgi:2'-5' RNA ligase
VPVIGVALSIPEPWAGELQAYRTSIDSSAALIPTHITLVPPTALEDDRLAVVEDHLTAVAAGVPAFDVHLRGTGTFRPISPVVFISLVEGISQTEQLAAAIRTGPLDVDVEFPFHPHVTVAHHLDQDVMDRAFGDLGGFDAAFAVNAFHLYVHDDAQGWRPTREFPLAPAGG